MKISREFKVGVIIVISALLLYWGINFMKGNDIFAENRIFYATYENIEGLTVNKPVNINGLQVGQIKEIYFHPDTSGKIMVVLEINNNYPIPSNTIALIHSIGFLGEHVISLDLGDSFDMALSGDTLYTGKDGDLVDAVNQQVAPIKAKAEKLLGTLDTVANTLSEFLNENTRQDFMSSFVNLRQTFENLERSSASLERIITSNEDSISKFVGNLTALSQTLAENSDNLDNILTNFSSISDTIAKANIYEAISSLNEALATADSIVTKINEGDGSIGKLINDPELYDNLAEASNSLNRLLLDIKYNPNKYLQVSVFGSKERLSEEDIMEIEELRKQQIEEKEKEAEENQENNTEKK
ncbi:MAG: MlaD family protein [Schleiferiaceae bacterium]|nr:MlaD family protein [Schleiferiaceae bacterium]